MTNTIELTLIDGDDPRFDAEPGALPTALRRQLGAPPWPLRALVALHRAGYTVTVAASTADSSLPRGDADAMLRALDPAAFFELGAQLQRPARPKLAAALATVMDADESAVVRALQGSDSWTYRASDGMLQCKLAQGRGNRELRGGKGRLTTVADAWEAFGARGLIPLSWLEERRFSRSAEPKSQKLLTASTPATLRTAIAFAADAEAVQRCEQCVQEYAARLGELGAAGSTSVRWIADRDPAVRSQRTIPEPLRTLTGVFLRLDPKGLAALKMFMKGERQSRRGSWRTAVRDACGDYVFHALAYRAAAEAKIPLTTSARAWAQAFHRAHKIGLANDTRATMRLPKERVGEPLDPLRNPYAPMLDVLREGYVLSRLSATSARIAYCV